MRFTARIMKCELTCLNYKTELQKKKKAVIAAVVNHCLAIISPCKLMHDYCSFS